MVIKGDEWKDMRAYLVFRRQHLILERQKIPFIEKDESIRERGIIKLQGKIDELEVTIRILDGNIKEKSKFEYSKVQYLKQKKVENIRKQEATK